MSVSHRCSPLVVSVVALALLSIVGCTPPNTVKANRAVTTIAGTRDELTKASGQITATVATLDHLDKPGADLPALYKKLDVQIDDAEAAAKRAGERADDMRVRASEYVSAWQAENQKIMDPSLKASAEARSQKITDGYQRYADLAVQAREAYVPFILGLKDIRRYLASDMTPGAVAQAKPTIQKAIADGNTLNNRVNVLIGQLNEMSSDITTTGAPK